MAELPEDPTPELRAPDWAGKGREVRFFDLFDKYRRRVTHRETGLPFEPTARASDFSLEKLAFHTRGPLKLALKVFFPICALGFATSFAWDWHGLLRSCSVAGMIGFGTNWVAIKMLFWPRESRPVFGHGLIPSQREQLVDKVASEVLENLINEELIQAKVRETRIVSRFTEATVEKLKQVVADAEFKEDVRQMVLTYVGDVASKPEFRAELAARAEARLEEFAGDRFRGWLVRRMREVWRGPMVDFLNDEIGRLDQTLVGGLDELDGVLEHFPLALERRQESIDAVLTTMLLGLVREVDIREIVVEQLSTITTEQLEQGFLEFSDDKLSYITLLGGIFGVIGGSVIVWPLPAIGVLLAGVAALAVLDLVAYRVIRSRFWPWRVDDLDEDQPPAAGSAR